MTKQFEKKHLKQVKNQSQSGRSMIEMLGVLAIIAILSIGGIVGYKLAMNYYQADQIANEINLMRNDLKVKYALGNEELLLGNPYDDTPENENYSGHLSTQYDRYPVDYDCIRKDKAEFYSCREADAYYIKVGNVSKGVCKPLTTLLNAMDGLMYIEINKKVYKEDDLCTSDEANEFYIQFDAEDVDGNYDSNRPEGWCGKDDDCDASRPVCDVANHECVECIDHTDCKDSNKPRCNVEQGSCESCPDGQSWNINKNMCTVGECESNDDCNINGRTGYYCYLEFGYSCESGNEFNSNKGFGAGQDGYKSVCKKAEDEVIRGKTSGYVISQSKMNWWSSQRYCLALQRSPATRMSIGCFIDGGELFYCSSEVMNKLKSDFMNKIEGDYPNAAWLDDYDDECEVYAPDFNDGRIFPFPRHYYTHNGGHALCQ